MRWWDATINNRGPRGRSSAFVCGLSSRVVGLHSVAVLPLGGSAGCAAALEISSGRRGPSPQAFTPFGEGYCLVPKKGDADGAEGIFGLAGRVWASALRPAPP